MPATHGYRGMFTVVLRRPSSLGRILIAAVFYELSVSLLADYKISTAQQSVVIVA